ncbi:MAG TPA: polyphenol oxidase family protein [bacterium]|nr:polyphenol oxidase family protein [bacterium]HPJ71315.1 polyphenol oxidase family protein [bacterium]HPQ66954.1 polyphenol oxidase family protein [bacterium]
MTADPAARIVHGRGLSWLEFRGGPERRAGFSLKPYDAAAKTPEELARDFSRAGRTTAAVALSRHVHGDRVIRVEAAGAVDACDGLVTARPGLTLAARAADCLLIFLWDREGPARGLIHAGRRGTSLGIAEAAVAALEADLGVPPERLTAVFSPCILTCCYAVDLVAENRRQLDRAGVEKVVSRPLCTCCGRDWFHSYRRGDRQKRMVGWI